MERYSNDLNFKDDREAEMRCLGRGGGVKEGS